MSPSQSTPILIASPVLAGPIQRMVSQVMLGVEPQDDEVFGHPWHRWEYIAQCDPLELGGMRSRLGVPPLSIRP